jgi:hypothetical protein
MPMNLVRLVKTCLNQTCTKISTYLVGSGAFHIHNGLNGRKETPWDTDLGLCGRIILKWILRKWSDMNWFQVAQNRVQWQTVVNKPSVPARFLTS